MPWMLVERAGEALGCSAKTVRRRRARGELEGEIREDGKLWVLVPDEQMPPEAEGVLDGQSMDSGLEGGQASEGVHGLSRRDERDVLIEVLREQLDEALARERALLSLLDRALARERPALETRERVGWWRRLLGR